MKFKAIFRAIFDTSKVSASPGASKTRYGYNKANLVPSEVLKY